MPTINASFRETFATVRGLLEANAKGLMVHVDKPGEFEMCSTELVDREGRPLFVAAVRIKKNYVSFHLIPVYAFSELLQEMSPSLRKRMQGKSCFNFTTIDPALLKELRAVTKKALLN